MNKKEYVIFYKEGHSNRYLSIMYASSYQTNSSINDSMRFDTIEVAKAFVLQLSKLCNYEIHIAELETNLKFIDEV